MPGLTQDKRIGQSITLLTKGKPDITLTLIRWGDIGKKVAVYSDQAYETFFTRNHAEGSATTTIARPNCTDIKVKLLKSPRNSSLGRINIEADDSVIIRRDSAKRVDEIRTQEAG